MLCILLYSSGFIFYCVVFGHDCMGASVQLCLCPGLRKFTHHCAKPDSEFKRLHLLKNLQKHFIDHQNNFLLSVKSVGGSGGASMTLASTTNDHVGTIRSDQIQLKM